ncbi:DNA internalization-related competence protein ComEC/Rec2 [Lactococcus formosensis]|uniref:DNA internalization-related competence protein ComEC/Rec2 n=1 Tax=Lactococcus formosensis TaxID=1281486 RepID=UPI0024353AC7|nr:DNA internalization-related competence protein ComEC/Rec2 [Lactococcus formosensis]MDG6112895.1 DNA internalization-related competence protein ComEC/Rec2 [Lactococcus formosensis]MDG6150856.1 DNA internalization-related competence protein ComEC/Rec2 [Lactococcus formosensis]MDG6174142.1 DNA internalization-related competence protein ComEC/Rec2 [Lactococcus formosensis]MDG6180744.1 DNA internalization-related competence protein ComEC/Rec2 [Lactococcus formosensis]MDG6184672.1 DNA internaliza
MKQKFSLIYLVYLLVLVYFLIFSFSWPIIVFSLFSIIVALYRQYYGLLALLLCFSLFLHMVKKEDELQENKQPAKISKITPYMDTLQVNGSRLSFRGEVDGRDYQAFYTLSSEKEKEYFKNLAVKGTLYLEGTLEIPEGQRNFTGFDYRKYLRTQGIYRLLEIEKIHGFEQTYEFDLRLIRRRAILWTQEHFPAPMSSYMTGLLFGWLDKDFEEMEELYTSLGIIHLFALSGMQVNFFIELLRNVLPRLGLSRKLVFFIQIPFSIFYAFLTGLSLSILRALLQKNIPFKNPSDRFSITFLLLIVFSPYFLLTTGGQLTMLYSFLITFISRKFKEVKGLKKSLLDSTVLAVGVLPLLIFHFHSFQPLSIILTLLFSMIFDFLLLPGLLFVFLLSLLGINLTLLNPFFVVLESVVKLVGNLFDKPIVFGKPDIIFLLLFFILSGLILDFYKKRNWNLVIILVLFCIFFLVKNPKHPSITMVDVAQGDSILLQDSWNSKNILIDTGGRLKIRTDEHWREGSYKSNAERTLLPYLRARGVSKIDALIVTHPDEDHIGDLKSVAQKVPIKNIYVSASALEKQIFVKKLSSLKSQIHIVQEGDKIPIFNSYLRFLTTGGEGKSDNDNSLVTFGEFYGKKFLFTGDLEEEGEAKLQKGYPHLEVDILKVGHHGSKTSTKEGFLEAIKPKVALISAGKNNRYKHPSQETLHQLTARGIKIYRTDQQGAIRLLYKKGSWQIQTVK